MVIDLLSKDDTLGWKKIVNKNYCAINRHHNLKVGKSPDDLDKVKSYKENEYVIADTDDVFKSIEELGKKIYDRYTKEVIRILTLQPVSDIKELKNLLHRWIRLNGFPYYIDESIDATVSEEVLFKFVVDSVLMYLFNLIHKLCAITYRKKDEYTGDIEYLDKLLTDIKFSELLDTCVKHNKDNGNLPPEAIDYGKELLKSIKGFSADDYDNDLIMKINQALLYIVTTEIRNRDELDAFLAQPVINKKLGLIVLDTFNSLAGLAYHKLITKIANIEVEEIRCRNCKAWVPKKSRNQKYCTKTRCQTRRKNESKKK